MSLEVSHMSIRFNFCIKIFYKVGYIHTRWYSNPRPNKCEPHALATGLQPPHVMYKHTNMYILQECIMYN